MICARSRLVAEDALDDEGKMAGRLVSGVLLYCNAIAFRGRLKEESKLPTDGRVLPSTKTNCNLHLAYRCARELHQVLGCQLLRSKRLHFLPFTAISG